MSVITDSMFVIHQTDEFEEWLDKLADRKAKGIIRDRLLRIQGGNLGDVEPVGGGVSEIKIHFGAGYRLYFIKQGLVLILLLCGGDKGTQRRDINKAKAMAAELGDGE
jgi:putative addiction module killer protein